MSKNEVNVSDEILDRIAKLEETVYRNQHQPSSSLTRKELAGMLSCSERFIQDHPELQTIERRLGRRVFYLREEVDALLRTSKIGRKINRSV